MAAELPYLAAFHAVCAEGGFTAAARRLGCSQPAISYQVRALEKVMRARLIERGGRRLLLTPAGESVRTLCQDLFAELSRVRSECAESDRRDPLRLSSASGFGRYVLLPALRVLEKESEGRSLGLRLLFDSADVVLSELERGEVEAAFVYHRIITNRLRSRAVYGEELVLIQPCGFDWPSNGGVAPDLGDFDRIPFVTYVESEYVFGRWFEWNFGDSPAGIASVAHFSELEETIDTVGRGAGVSIVPRDSAAAALSEGNIEIMYAGRAEPCINQVYMVVRAGSVTRPELRRLAEIVREWRVAA